MTENYDWTKPDRAVLFVRKWTKIPGTHYEVYMRGKVNDAGTAYVFKREANKEWDFEKLQDIVFMREVAH